MGQCVDEMWSLVEGLRKQFRGMHPTQKTEKREPLEQRISCLTDVMQNLLTFMVQEKMEKSKEHTATEEKKSPEPVPISVKPVEKLPESENDVVYWGM
jgi:hypothetical protein